MTGARPTRKRFINAHIKKDEDYPEAVSLPMLLRNNGYTTISNGKIYHYNKDDANAWNDIYQAPAKWNSTIFSNNGFIKTAFTVYST